MRFYPLPLQTVCEAIVFGLMGVWFAETLGWNDGWLATAILVAVALAVGTRLKLGSSPDLFLVGLVVVLAVSTNAALAIGHQAIGYGDLGTAIAGLLGFFAPIVVGLVLLAMASEGSPAPELDDYPYGQMST